MKSPKGIFVALLVAQPVIFLAFLIVCLLVFSPTPYEPPNGGCGEDEHGVDADGLCHPSWEFAETILSLITASAGVAVFDTAAIVLILVRRRRKAV